MTGNRHKKRPKRTSTHHSVPHKKKRKKKRSHSHRTNRKRNRRKKVSRKADKGVVRKRLSNVKLLGACFVASFVIVLGSTLLATSFGKMEGYSMLPEVNNKDVFTVDKVSRIQRFDLVYFNVPDKANQTSVRRVIGLPGDELFYKNDELFVNNEGKPERYLNSRKSQLVDGILTDDFNLVDLTGQPKVPPKSYFVMGDNRQSSTDSRDYGFVNESQLIGKVDMKLVPFNYFQRYK